MMPITTSSSTSVNPVPPRGTARRDQRIDILQTPKAPDVTYIVLPRGPAPCKPFLRRARVVTHTSTGDSARRACAEVVLGVSPRSAREAEMPTSPHVSRLHVSPFPC